MRRSSWSRLTKQSTVVRLARCSQMSQSIAGFSGCSVLKVSTQREPSHLHQYLAMLSLRKIGPRGGRSFDGTTAGVVARAGGASLTIVNDATVPTMNARIRMRTGQGVRFMPAALR
jgi:hypothetical protein